MRPVITEECRLAASTISVVNFGWMMALCMRPLRCEEVEEGFLDSFDRNSEHVSDTAFGPNYPRRAGVAFELSSQTKNLHIDAAVEDIFVDSGRLQKVFAGERPLRGVEKRNQ